MNRRLFIASSLSAGLAGCGPIGTALNGNAGVRNVLASVEHLDYALFSGENLAREYPKSAIAPFFRVNGFATPDDAPYRALLASHFSSYRLVVDGAVERPLALSLAQIARYPQVAQITRHDCVEGWSAIGQWTGARLSAVLALAGLAPSARYIVFRCADDLAGDGGRYYESIDLFDAFHPQTILAYAMNDQPLAVEHGAPLRLRVERQLGYKQAKYVMRIEAVDRLPGKGGFWEDRGYEWYAGI